VVLVAGAGAGYWLYGDRFPSVLSRAARGAADKVTDAAVHTSERLDSSEGARVAAEQEARREAARAARDRELGWVTLTDGKPAAPRSARAANPLAPLTRRAGPAYVSLSAAEVAGLLAPLVRQLPPSATVAQLALDNDQLLLRADVALRDFAGEGAFGSVIGKALDGHDTLFLAGPIEPVRPGLAQFRVRELRIKGIDVPTRVIPSLTASLRRRAQRAASGTAAGSFDGVANDALPIPLPATVADVRIVNGKLTLYRATSPASVRTP
jgi:hypothetical protein